MELNDGKILPVKLEDEMRNSYIDYAMSVIVSRAIPDVRDGLKPVHRRILYGMLEEKMNAGSKYKKSARIVGSVLGKYHPHGDSSVYDAIVRMAQDFSMRYMLADGQGNFGSVDGDPAAAMRYTEVRMSRISELMLQDIDKETVDFVPNYDESLKEPSVLPSKFPELLVNGTSGIAVGMATNIPPHNLNEVIDGTLMLIDNPEATIDELMTVIKGPDFPTGGLIMGTDGIRSAYTSGRGVIKMRAKVNIETMENGKSRILVTELPYQVNKAKLIEKIADLVREKEIEGITDLRDESDRNGMSVVIELRRDVNPDIILNQLYKHTQLQESFGVIMLALVDNQPQILNLKQVLHYYIKHQQDVITRRTRFELSKAEARAHILEGLNIALDHLDAVITTIRESRTAEIAKEALIEGFKLSEKQAQAILDLRLQRLTNLERLAIEKEYREVGRLIKEYKGILSSEEKLRAVIRREMLAIKEKYAVPRRTRLIQGEEEIVVSREDMIVVDDAIVALLEGGKIRRLPKRNFTAESIASEKPVFIMETQTDRRLRFFTSHGNCLIIGVDELPEARLTAKATNLNSLVQLEKGEEIVACFDEVKGDTLVFYTALGSAKRTEGKEFDLRTKKTAAIALKDDDRVIAVEKQDETAGTVIMVSKGGMSIRFMTDTVPVMGKGAGGVKCMKLDGGDRVIFAAQIADEGEILTISDRGYAKRSLVFDYEIQGRNGKGLKTFDFKKNGSNGTAIAAALYVKEPYDIVIRQFHGEETVVNTETVFIEQRPGKGMLTVMALLDDIVIGAKKIKS